jgi:hypothetical protein
MMATAAVSAAQRRRRVPRDQPAPGAVGGEREIRATVRRARTGRPGRQVSGARPVYT